jgi:putative endonuclease
MAVVYILFSEQLDRFYIGSCQNIEVRFKQHWQNIFGNSYTRNANDWVVYFTIEGLQYKQARLIEAHIKRMKSKIYIKNLSNYPDLVEKLIKMYAEGSSR